MRLKFVLALLVTALALPAVMLHARQTGPAGAAAVMNALTFRNIGPFRTSAWVTDIAVPPPPRAVE